MLLAYIKQKMVLSSYTLHRVQINSEWNLPKTIMLLNFLTTEIPFFFVFYFMTSHKDNVFVIVLFYVIKRNIMKSCDIMHNNNHSVNGFLWVMNENNITFLNIITLHTLHQTFAIKVCLSMIWFNSDVKTYVVLHFIF